MRVPVPPFVFPELPMSWYIGHMHRAMREITELTQSHSLDLIIETRDSRLPLTSINPAFERLLQQQAGHGMGIGAREGGGGGIGRTKRLIVYNKADLAQECFREPLQRALEKQGEKDVLFTDSRDDAEVRRLLRAAIRLAKRPLEGPDDKITMLVAGMPNVGKSSILNALRRVGVRKGKAASTSSEPGHTRRLSTVIKIATSPPVYIYDTPGIMVPFLGKGVAGQEAALKLALTGGIKESLFERDVVAEYLLWRLRVRAEMRDEGWSNEELLRRLSLPSDTPLDEPTAFFSALARRLSALQKGGEPDVDFAGRWLIHAFREGKLGRWTMDGLGRGGEAVDDARQCERAVKKGVVESGEVWRKTETRWGFLSEKKAAKEDEEGEAFSSTDAADAREAASPATVAPTPFSDADLVEESPLSPTSSSAPSSSSDSPAASCRIDAPVLSALTYHTTYLRSLSSSLSLQSSHQSKKAQKAEQARIREVKRRSHDVAQAGGGRGGGKKKAKEKVWMGWKGAKGGPKAWKPKGFGFGGPKVALSSARRRKYRRSAGGAKV
ncbi:hypothetical protein JCM8547_003280 [Rhodosporidiobolus lusitaniae]